MATHAILGELDDSSLVNLVDTLDRAAANGKITDAQFRMFYTLLSRHSELLEGNPVSLQMHEERAACGWKSKAVAAAFFKALVEIGAISYDSGKYSQSGNERIGLVTPNDDVLPYPETFDLRNSKALKADRESKREKQRELKAALLPIECPQCGNAHLLYDITAKCPDCGHMQEPYVGIPSRLITVDDEASLDDVFDGLLPEEGE